MTIVGTVFSSGKKICNFFFGWKDDDTIAMTGQVITSFNTINCIYSFCIIILSIDEVYFATSYYPMNTNEYWDRTGKIDFHSTHTHTHTQW